MLLYWLIFVLFAAGALFGQQRSGLETPVAGNVMAQPGRRSLVLRLAGLSLILIIGLRYRVGGDWANYLFVYSEIQRVDFGQAFAVSRQEPAYTLINWVSAQLGAGMWLVNLLCAIPFTIGLLRLCRQFGNLALSLTVATPFLIIVVGMGYTRQAVALGFLMMGIGELIEKKSFGRFIAFALLGALFHRTVLVFIPIILLARSGGRLGSLFLLSVTLLIGYLTVFQDTVAYYGAGYLKSDYNAAGAQVRIAMNLLPAVILLLAGNRLYRSPEERIVWRTFAILSVMAAIALPVVRSNVIVDRLSLYLIPLQLFVFGRLADPRTSSAASGLLWTALAAGFSAVVLFVWLNYADNAWAWVPYRSYLISGM